MSNLLIFNVFINLSMIPISVIVKLVYLSLMIMVINGINVIIIVLIRCLNVRILHGKQISFYFSHQLNLCFSFSHITPEHQAVYTSTDSSVISPPIRHTPVEPMSDQKEIQIPPTPYQPSRPPSAGLSNRPYPYTSKYLNSIRYLIIYSD